MGSASLTAGGGGVSTNVFVAALIGCLVVGILIGCWGCFLRSIFAKGEEANKVEGDQEDEGETAMMPVVSHLEVGEVQENSPSDASANGGVLVDSRIEVPSEPRSEAASEQALMAMQERVPEVTPDQNDFVLASKAESGARDVKPKPEAGGSTSGHRRRKRRHHTCSVVEGGELKCEAEVGGFATVPVPYANSKKEAQKWAAQITGRSHAWSVSESEGTIGAEEGELPFTLMFAPSRKGVSEAELRVTVGQVEVKWMLVGTGV
jgi:hypothetical protein